MPTLQEALLLAYEHQCAGRRAEAEEWYARILDAVPGFPPALHLLGVLRGQQGRFAEGRRLIERAIAGDPATPDFCTNLAALLEALGEHGPAVELRGRAAALDPTRLGPLNNAAVRHQREGRPALAVLALRLALRLRPLDDGLRANLGRVLGGLGGGEVATGHLRAAMLLAPGDPDHARALGERLLAAAMDSAEGGAALRRALLLAPDRAAVWNLLGCHDKRLWTDGHAGLAERAFRRGLALAPDSADPWNNLASVRKGLGDVAGAVRALERAAALIPDSAPVLNNLADALLLAGRPEAALERADAALARTPDLGEARVTRAMALLSLGRFAEGWDAWEERWSVDPWRGAARRFPQPAWDGGPLGGRLLVWGEQGVGDEIQFAGLLPRLTAAGVRCVLECDSRLTPLFARSLPGVEVVARRTPPDPRATAPDLAAQIPAGSLPRLLLRPEEDARLEPWLVPDAARASAFRAPDRRAIGIAWHTTNPKYGRARGVPLRDLAQALWRPGRRLVVLQYGDWAGEVAALAARGIDIVLPRGLDRRDDLDGLAALMAALDHVATIDNVTAHMAGALGRPLSVLLAHAPDWRWLRDRADSPWYPTATLHRQTIPGDWSGPLEALRREVDDRLG